MRIENFTIFQLYIFCTDIDIKWQCLNYLNCVYQLIKYAFSSLVGHSSISMYSCIPELFLQSHPKQKTFTEFVDILVKLPIFIYSLFWFPKQHRLWTGSSILDLATVAVPLINHCCKWKLFVESVGKETYPIRKCFVGLFVLYVIFKLGIVN